MKKIIISLFCLLSFCSFAHEIDMSKLQTENIIPTNFTMPSDEEIRATINTFNFDEKQKEILFKETKKKLQEMCDKQANDALNK